MASRPAPSLGSPAATPSGIGPSTSASIARGRPYSADTFEVILRDPANRITSELRQPWLAEILADEIWSWDGAPYARLRVFGSCKTRACRVEVDGVAAFVKILDQSGDEQPGEDSVTLTLDRVDHQVTEVHRSLPGVPASILADAEQMARSLDVDHRLAGLPLYYGTWLLPPPDDAYELLFGNGTQEGQTTVTVVVDRAARRIISIQDVHH